MNNKNMQLAEILRSAARGTITEVDFWDQLKVTLLFALTADSSHSDILYRATERK
jgi:hypothetical protein